MRTAVRIIATCFWILFFALGFGLIKFTDLFFSMTESIIAHLPYSGSTAKFLANMKIGDTKMAVNSKQAMSVYIKAKSTGMMVTRRQQPDGTFLMKRIR